MLGKGVVTGIRIRQRSTLQSFVTLLIFVSVVLEPRIVLGSIQCAKVGEQRTRYGITEVCRPVGGQLQWVKQTTTTTTLRKAATTTTKPPVRPTRKPTTTTTNPPVRPTRKPTTTTSTVASALRGQHGKMIGSTTLWSSGNIVWGLLGRTSQFSIELNSSEAGLVVAANFPTAQSTGIPCSNGGEQFYLVSAFMWLGPGQTIIEGPKYALPVLNNTDGLCSWGLLSLHTLWSQNQWFDMNLQRLSVPPAPFYIKFRVDNRRTREVFDVPWVLINVNAYP
jgi:hypothetical protein